LALATHVPGVMAQASPADAASAATTSTPLPRVSSGRIERLAQFASNFVDARPVDVWLPANYDAGRRHKVVYVHDGQMLFDPAHTWNKKSWNLSGAMGRLLREGRIPDTLVVAIWSHERGRQAEYFPQKMLAHLAPAVCDEFVASQLAGRPRSDDYLRFIVEELKPKIDRRYRTRPEREHTLVMGADLGGQIALYAMNEYPEVFGGAAGLSTHWMGRARPNDELPQAALAYLREHLAPADGHRLYMDQGDQGLDAACAPYQAAVDQLIAQRWPEHAWLSRQFGGTGHDESNWAARVHIPLLFLLLPRTAAS
jgi:enterochelin esterase-like enzyme